MITVTCDHCKQPIGADGCVYVLAAMDPARLNIPNPVMQAHLHWDCVPVYGRIEPSNDAGRPTPAEIPGGE